MADQIDPNDLDSIDALLDEAELESSESEEPELAEAEAEPPVSEAPGGAEEEDLLESLADDTPVAEEKSAEEPSEPESEPEPEPIRVPDDGEAMPPKTEPIEPAQNVVPEPEVDPEAILAQRQKKKQNKTQASQTGNNLSVKEMEAIKKLIIIFSSVLIVLGLVTIGLSTWAALSASKSLDEESKQTLEDIKGGTNEVAMKAMSMSKDVKDLHKKLDALSFQLEQLNGDMQSLTEKIEKGSMAVSQMQVGAKPVHSEPYKEQGHHANTHEKAATASTGHEIAVPAAATPLVAKVEPALMKKMREVNANVIKVQKRIAEINHRIRALQKQYGYLLKGVKRVEKGVLQSEVKKTEESHAKTEKHKKEAASEPKQSQGLHPLPGYIYQAPDYVY